MKSKPSGDKSQEKNQDLSNFFCKELAYTFGKKFAEFYTLFKSNTSCLSINALHNKTGKDKRILKKYLNIFLQYNLFSCNDDNYDTNIYKLYIDKKQIIMVIWDRNLQIKNIFHINPHIPYSRWEGISLKKWSKFKEFILLNGMKNNEKIVKKRFII